MRFALMAALAVFLMLFGCINMGQPQAPTGMSANDYNWASGRINATGNTTPLMLHVAMSKHVYMINTSNKSTWKNYSTYSLIGAKLCNVTPFGMGVAGANASVFNFSAAGAVGANASFLLYGIMNPERNHTLTQLNVTYNNSAGENVSVYLNANYLGLLNQSVTQTIFTTIPAGYVINGTNNVSFRNDGTVSDIINVTLTYNSSVFTCSQSDTVDGAFLSLPETADASGQLNFTITNTTIISTDAFNMSIYGGDIGVKVNTNSTYVGIYRVNQSFCDHFGFQYALPWNTTGWVNITNIPTSTYSTSAGVVRACLVRKIAGNVSNYGAIVDGVSIFGSTNTSITSRGNATVSMLGSIDCQNWVTLATSTTVIQPVMVQTNNTLTCVMFNVTALALDNPSVDGIHIRYVGTTN